MQNRRNFLALSGLFCAGSLTTLGSNILNADSNSKDSKKKKGFSCCLNTSTIREKSVGIVSNIEITAKAGYDGIEPWMRDISKFVQDGGKLSELKKRFVDNDLAFENVIAFHKWIVDDKKVREAALTQFKTDLDMLAQLGCKRIAAPPLGATKGDLIDLDVIAERYNTILEVAKPYGIKPVLEIWGHSVNLQQLSKAMAVIFQCKNETASILPDVYHLHRGGSGYSGLPYLNSKAVSMFHINDFPGTIEAPNLKDADRVFPGDGVAPYDFIAEEIRRINPEMVLSLELFNPEYWKMEPLEAAKTGLNKMKRIFG